MTIHPDKSRGQNFLIDKNVLGKIIAAAELKSSDTVIEIGAGQGVLTAELAKRAGKIIAFEIDKKLANLLKEKFEGFKNVEIIEGDVMKRVGAPLVGARCQGQAQGLPLHYKIIANIPYNITSAVLEKFLSAENKPSLMVLMVQREVAERVCAKPGEMSFLSVMTQYYGQPEIVARVPASAFWPRPKVDSAILKITVGATRWVAPTFADDQWEQFFFQIVKAGFSHRRKMLKNNLVGARFIAPQTINCCRGEGAINCAPTRVEKIFASLGLSPTVRAEELKVAEWQKLALLWYNITNE